MWTTVPYTSTTIMATTTIRTRRGTPLHNRSDCTPAMISDRLMVARTACEISRFAVISANPVC
jgi:hypothetical protein